MPSDSSSISPIWSAAHNKHGTQGKPKKRVLMVFSSLGTGGAETWLMALLEYFKAHSEDLPVEIQVDILLTSGTRAHFDDKAIALGARLFYLPYTRKHLSRFVRGFRRILAQGRYDAIHDHQDYTAGLHFLFGAGVLPAVRIAHAHNPLLSLTFHYKSPLRRIICLSGKRLLAHFATHIMGTSRQVLTEYGFDEPVFANVVLGAAHCGFDVTQFQDDYAKRHSELCREFGWDADSRILLFAGRLSSNLNQKNPSFALEVAKECVARDARVQLLMAGGGEKEKAELEAMVKCWGLEKSLLLIGNRDDVPRLMTGADLFLFPSVAEGLGMVAVEAQAAALRVLASDAVPKECEVLPEMVRFLPLGAGASAWADVALHLLNAERPDPLVCNGTVAHSAFSIENSAHRLLRLYGA